MQTRSFLEDLRDTQLLESGQLEQVRGWPQAQAPDSLALARELIQRDWLTAYQANALSQGRGKELTLDAYHVLDRLGEGGMGQVLKARHRTMNRVVALKIIRKEMLAKPDAVNRFRQEIQAAAQLIHPNIVVAYDAGQANGTHFFAMEFVEGIDLGNLVQKSGPLPVVDACTYIRQAALGLQHAHERGMVHRDIKPSNLLLSRTSAGAPVVKILDMGLARLQDAANAGLTRTGVIMGSPAFLSPEQALNSTKVDIRADLYSLGCTFYFILTGKPPFEACAFMELLFKHREEEPQPVARLRAGVPAGVQAIISKLLAKRPDDRYQTPAELVVALKALRESANTGTSRTGMKSMRSKKKLSGKHLPAGTGKPRRRTFVMAGGLAVAVLLAGVALAVFSRTDRSPVALASPLVTLAAPPVGLATPPVAAPSQSELVSGDPQPDPEDVVLPAPTTKGILVIVADPAAKTLFNSKGVAVVDKAENRKVLKTGEHELLAGYYEVDLASLPDTLEVSNGDFTIDPSRKARISITKRPAPAVVQVVPTVPSGPEEKWRQEVAALPAAKQVDAVLQKLSERNRGFNPKGSGITHKIAKDAVAGKEAVTELALTGSNARPIVDVSPLRALVSLQSFTCRGTEGEKVNLHDLRPLRGLKLKALDVRNTKVEDLSPLKGIPLEVLDCRSTRVNNLEPLKGMPLRHLCCAFVPGRNDLIRSTKTLETVNERPVKEFLRKP